MKENCDSKSRRRDRAGRITAHDKKLLALDKEVRRLYRVRWNAPLIELDRPYQSGWLRYFELTPEAKRRKDADDLEKPLALFNHRQRSRHRDFRKPKASKRSGKPAGFGLRKLRADTLLRERCDEALLKYVEFRRRPIMTLERLIEIFLSCPGYRVSFRYPQYAKVRVEPYMITHQRVDLPEVRQRIDEIETYFESCHGRQRLAWLRGRRCYWKFNSEFAKLKAQIADREVETAFRFWEGPDLDELSFGKIVEVKGGFQSPPFLHMNSSIHSTSLTFRETQLPELSSVVLSMAA